MHTLAGNGIRWPSRLRCASKREGAAALGSGSEVTTRHEDLASLALAARHTLTQHDARVLEGLPRINCPTLVLVGERDTPFLQASRVMARRIPGAELVTLADAGHAANLDQPVAFNEAVAAFLARAARLALIFEPTD